MKTLNFLVALILAIAFSWSPVKRAAAQSVPTPIEKQWNIEGDTRKALLYIPASATREKAPVIFAFHGHGGSMEQADRSFAYEDYWPEAIVIYMQGLNTPGKLTDHGGNRPGWQAGPGEQKDRDLKFFDAVLASIKADYKVDDSRIFAAGHSNGGSFTYLLWATRGSVFRAVAPSGAIPGSSGGLLRPKPVIHVAGENDPLVRFAWQQRTIDRLKTLNTCDTIGTAWAKAGTITGTKYTSKTGNPLITLLYPGGHRFPTEAPALIVRFFKENSTGNLPTR